MILKAFEKDDAEEKAQVEREKAASKTGGR